MAGVKAVVKIVTGYTEIPNHPRGTADYRALGEQLLAAIVPDEGLVFDHASQTWQDTFLARLVKSQSNISHSVADNPEKNTLAYHCVMHQKFEWLRTAAALDIENPADVYVWIDFGIMHVPGVTAAVIRKYLDRIGDYGGQIMIPGCWPKSRDGISGSVPCWRFCGGLFSVPRPLVNTFTTAATRLAVRQIMTTRNIEWEVNTLARLEQMTQVPFGWYQADHNETMFEALP